jgi:hypothetical protein
LRHLLLVSSHAQALRGLRAFVTPILPAQAERSYRTKVDDR